MTRFVRFECQVEVRFVSLTENYWYDQTEAPNGEWTQDWVYELTLDPRQRPEDLAKMRRRVSVTVRGNDLPPWGRTTWWRRLRKKFFGYRFRTGELLAKEIWPCLSLAPSQLTILGTGGFVLLKNKGEEEKIFFGNLEEENE